MATKLFLSVALALVIVVVIFNPFASAARKGNVASLVTKKANMTPVKRDGGSSIRSRLSLGDNTDVEEEDNLVSAQGCTKRKYRETYQGKKVYNTGIDVEEFEGGNAILGGDFYLDLEGDLEGAFDCELSDAEAKDITLNYFGIDPVGLSVEREDFDNWIFMDENTVAHYAKSVELYVILVDDTVSRPHAFIDVCTKVVLDAFDRKGLFTVGTSVTPGTGSTDDGTTYGYTEDGTTYRYTDDETTYGSTDDGTTYGSTDATSDSTDDYTGATDSTGATDDPGKDTDETDNPDTTGQRTNPPPTVDPPSADNCDVKDKAGNPKRPINIGSEGFCLNPMRRSTDRVTCHLANQYIKVVDLKNKNDDTKTNIASFTCAEGYDDERNGGFSPILDAFFFSTKSILMFREWYSFAPLTNPIPYAKVHYRRNYVNAYWDGRSLVFGDGDGDETYPLTGLDTVAHELAHGVTEKASNLAYRRESGGMNEAFSDMAGEAAEVYVFKSSDWVSGDEMFVEKNKALRYFDDPTKDGVSIKHVRDYTNRMDVHYSSGIYNHVFYLIANELGIKAAFECFVTANRLYWREESTFEQGACGTLRGAYDGGFDMDVVAEAFRAVGITMEQCPRLLELVSAELTSGTTQRNLRVSRLRHPIFKITVPTGKTKVTIYGSEGLEIAIGASYERDGTPLTSGTGSVTIEVSQGDVVYARFYRGISAGDDEITDGTASVTFS